MEKWQNQFYIQKILNVVHYSLFPFPHLEKSCLSCTICIGSYYLTSHLSLGRDGKQYLNRHFLGYRRKWSTLKPRNLRTHNLRTSVICGLYFGPKPRNLLQNFGNLRFFTTKLQYFSKIRWGKIGAILGISN